MANSTQAFWSVNGVSLQTYAFNVSTWGGDLQSPPTQRGSDITIPYRPGSILMQRRPEGRSLTFNMWVVGATEDGKVPTNATMRAEFEKNFKKIRDLFWNNGNPITLTRRWRDYGSSTVKAAAAEAIFVSGFAPTMNGSQRASFSVEVYLPDPFFYGPEVTIEMPSTASSTVTVDIPGDYETTKIVLTASPTRNNFRFTNLSEGVYVNVNREVSSGYIRIDVDDFTVKRNNGGNAISYLDSFGHPFWFVLRPGEQQLRLTSSSGNGPATIRYRPRYI